MLDANGRIRKVVGTRHERLERSVGERAKVVLLGFEVGVECQLLGVVEVLECVLLGGRREGCGSW